MTETGHLVSTRRGGGAMSEWRPRGGQRSRTAVTRTVGALALIAVAAGCSGGGHGGTAQSASTAPVSPPATSPGVASPSVDVRAQVLNQYRAFWAHLTPASRAVPSSRVAILSPFAVDPELRSLLTGMASGDQ